MSYDEERMNRMKPILDRIPERWGKYLPREEWDEILLDLDRKMAEIDPDYTILQAKEKFFDLRFYYELSPGADEHDEAMAREAVAQAERAAWEERKEREAKRA